MGRRIAGLAQKALMSGVHDAKDRASQSAAQVLRCAARSQDVVQVARR
jgi:hypothetical protein